MGKAAWLPLLLMSLAPPYALAQRSDAPSLFLRFVSQRGSQTLGPLRSVQVPGNERIHLNICVRARSIEDRFEQPDIAALNKGPAYFAHRPPPNIVLTVYRVASGPREEVPFRVNSSGGGKNLEVYYVDAELDLLEAKAVRLQRAQEFVDWMLAQPGPESRSQLLQA